MRKIDYDFYVDDQIQVRKYQVTIRCKFYSTVFNLKKFFNKQIKKQFDIIHNDVTLDDSKILDQIFSRNCLNAITICIKSDPMIDVLVRHSIQYQNIQKSKPNSKETFDEIIPIKKINQKEINNIEDNQNELVTQSTAFFKKCTSCGIQNKMIQNYELSIQNLIQENEQLQIKMNELQLQRNILIKRKSLTANTYKQLKIS